MSYYLRIVEANDDDDAFYTLGGAEFDSEADARANLVKLPEFRSADYIPNACIVELVDSDGTIIDDHEISTQTVESVLDNTIADLREKAVLDLQQARSKHSTDPGALVDSVVIA